MSRSRKEPEESNEMTSLATTTRNVVESYIFATGHQDLSIYSERLMMLLVKAAQCQVAGLNFKDGSSMMRMANFRPSAVVCEQCLVSIVAS